MHEDAAAEIEVPATHEDAVAETEVAAMHEDGEQQVPRHRINDDHAADRNSSSNGSDDSDNDEDLRLRRLNNPYHGYEDDEDEGAEVIEGENDTEQLTAAELLAEVCILHSSVSDILTYL